MTRKTAVSALALVALGVSVSAALLPAQTVAARPAGVVGLGLEVRPFAGGFVPTGDQRDLLTDAAAVGGQLGWRFHTNVALTGAFTWAPTKDRTTALTGSPTFTGREEEIDVFGYDLGVEARVPMTFATTWVWAPYVGLGGGGRSYRYRDLDGIDTETTPVGYGALGVDIAPLEGRVGLRLEARDYVSGFKGLRGEYAEREARNDVQLAGGITFRF